MRQAPCEELQRPLPGEAEQAHDEVENLKNGNGLDGAVEIVGYKVPKDLGPDEAFDGAAYLVCSKGG